MEGPEPDILPTVTPPVETPERLLPASENEDPDAPGPENPPPPPPPPGLEKKLPPPPPTKLAEPSNAPPKPELKLLLLFPTLEKPLFPALENPLFPENDDGGEGDQEPPFPVDDGFVFPLDTETDPEEEEDVVEDELEGLVPVNVVSLDDEEEEG